MCAGRPNAFWVFHVIRDYVRLIDADPRYLAVADGLERAQVPMPIVFGHHDLLPGNLIDDGRKLWLIDWEYGGFGTAMFDLANLSSNGAFGAAEDAALLDAYFDGKVSADLRRAFAAMKAASALREALWAMVSDVHLKTPGVDYEAHARDYLRRFEELIADRGLRLAHELRSEPRGSRSRVIRRPPRDSSGDGDVDDGLLAPPGQRSSLRNCTS